MPFRSELLGLSPSPIRSDRQGQQSGLSPLRSGLSDLSDP
jgi:hypothetical protein